jgi:hypothetical protein
VTAPATWKVWTALGLVYVLWGSTYLAIKYAVETLPAMLSAGGRFGLAGLLLAGWLGLRRGRAGFRATGRELLNAGVVGLLLLAGGNGLVTVAEERGLPSGLAALLVAVIPLWVVVLRASTGDRPAGRTVLGVALGFLGVAVLLLPGARPEGVALLPAAMVVFGAFLWSLGSFGATKVPLPADPLLTTIAQMAGGGVGARPRRAWSRGEELRLGRGHRRLLAGLGLPRGVRLDRRLHRLQLAAGRRAGQPGLHLRVREPGRGRAARRADRRGRRSVRRRCSGGCGDGPRGRDRGVGGGPPQARGAGRGGRPLHRDERQGRVRRSRT